MGFEKSSIEMEHTAEGMEAIRLRFKAAGVNAEAVVHLQGAHITEYCPTNSANVLWVSQSTQYKLGKAIRGGIPLCWPWFGASPEPGQPQHGVARSSLFELVSEEIQDECVAVILRLNAGALEANDNYAGLELEVEIRLSDSLWMEMRTKNLSDQSRHISECFHNYFDVEDIHQTQIPQLKTLRYLDKVQDFSECTQSTDFSVTNEVDRVYSGVGSQVTIDSLANKRRIAIETSGLEHMVVWNPWSEKAAQMSDFDDLGYQQMICVEPANATYGAIEVKPQSVHRSTQTIRLLEDYANGTASRS